MSQSAPRTSNPILLAIAGLLFLSAPWWLPPALPGMHFTRGWTIAFVAFGCLFAVMAWDSHRRRAAAGAA